MGEYYEDMVEVELACPNCGNRDPEMLNLAPGEAKCHECGTEYPIPEVRS
jgi:uncharacterized Zn finger protein